MIPFNIKQKDILIIIIFLFIFVLALIGESIYHSAVRSTISETTSQNIEPIAPTFDAKTIDNLKERQKIIPSFDLEIITPTPIILPTIPLPSDASQGGKLLL